MFVFYSALFCATYDVDSTHTRVSLPASTSLFMFFFLFCFFLMIRDPPIFTLDRSSAASDVYKRQRWLSPFFHAWFQRHSYWVYLTVCQDCALECVKHLWIWQWSLDCFRHSCCLLYTSDAADERSSGDLGGSRIIKKKYETNARRQRTISK